MTRSKPRLQRWSDVHTRAEVVCDQIASLMENEQ